MFRNTFSAGAFALSAIAALTCGCGLLGQKDETSKLLELSSATAGCLSQLGSRFHAYVQGDIEEDQWGASWDCAVRALNLFKRHVKQGSDRGFTREDIRDFVSRFLVTRVPVTPELVEAVFELKASLFGGTADVLAPAEIERMIEFLQAAKAESLKLLPWLRWRAQEPRPEHLLAFADALSSAAAKIGAALPSGGGPHGNPQRNPMFRWAAAQAFSDELGKVSRWELPPGTVEWLSAAKALLLAGSRDGIEGDAWPELIRAAAAYGGPAVAALSARAASLSGPNAHGELLMSLAWKLKAGLARTIDLHGGALPLAAVDQVLESLPAEWLAVDRPTIERALRPFVQRILGSRAPDALDPPALDVIFDQLDLWNRGQTHLERIFALLDADASGVSPDRFESAAVAYAEALPPEQRPDVYRLIGLSRRFRPLFLSGDNQITFVPQVTHSLSGLSRWHWMRLAIELMMRAYSSAPTHDRGTVDDLRAFVDDYKQLGFALHQIDPTIPGLVEKRFREANLFTFASDGDQYLDLDEATYYLAFVYSQGVLSYRVMRGMEKACPSLGKDILGFQWSSAECFRREYFGNFRDYWDHLPGLVRYYGELDDSGKLALQRMLERAARRYGYSDQPFARYDSDAIAGMTHYIEALLARFDGDGNQSLDLREAMRAYPVFKGVLAQLGHLNPSNDGTLKAAFTYTLHFGTTPTKNLGGIADFLAWRALEPFWAIHADRLALYGVLANISGPAPIPPGP